MNDQIILAKNLATKWHDEETMQTYDGAPYTVHLESVVRNLIDWGVRSNSDLIAAAWLHDIREDTDVPDADLDMFNDRILNVVDLVTDPDGINRAERKTKMYARWCESRVYKDGRARDAAIVKAADRYANQGYGISVKDVGKMRMYVAEFPKFYTSFAPELVDTGYGDRAMIDLIKQFETMVRMTA